MAQLLPPMVVEGEGMILELKRHNVTARLFGSVAVWIMCQPARSLLTKLRRAPKDLDLVTTATSTRALVSTLAAHGWICDEQLRAWSEGTRLRFRNRKTNEQMDVCVDKLRFAQTLDLRDRLDIHETCISPTDLLLSKLQIIKKTLHDVMDLVAILSSFEVGNDERCCLSKTRIAILAGSSWRWDKALTHAAIEAPLWPDVPGVHEFSRAKMSALARLTTLLDGSPVTARSAAWYIGAVGGSLGGEWFDEVEDP